MTTTFLVGTCCICKKDDLPVMVKKVDKFCKDCTPFIYKELDGLLRFIADNKPKRKTKSPKRDNDMTKTIHVLVNALYPDLKCVQVRFKDNPKKYSYKTLLDLEVGDEVIVKSPNDGFIVVAVVGNCADALEKYPLKWITQKVNSKHYDEVVAAEDEAVKKIRDKSSKNRRNKDLIAIKELLGYEDMTDEDLLEQLKGTPLLEG